MIVAPLPSVKVAEVTLVKPVKVVSRFNVAWSPLTAEVMFVPPAITTVS